MPKLGEVAEVHVGSARRDVGAGAELPLLITPAMISDAGITVGPEPARASGGELTKAGDVILTRAGEPAAALVPRELAGAAASEHVFIVRAIDEKIAASILSFFRSIRGRAALDATRVGSALPQSNVKAVSEIEIPGLDETRT